MEEINKVEIGGSVNTLESRAGESLERMKALNEENAKKIREAAEKLGIQIATTNYIKETKSVQLKSGKRFVKYEVKTTAHFFDKNNSNKEDIENEMDDRSFNNKMIDKVKGHFRSKVSKELMYKKPNPHEVPGSMGVRG